MFNIYEYDKMIVRKLFTNLVDDDSESTSKKFGKVYVRGQIFDCSPNAINYLFYLEDVDEEENIDERYMMKILTGGKLN